MDQTLWDDKRPENTPMNSISDTRYGTAAPASTCFEDLYRKEYPRLFGRLLSLVGQRETAEDLAQETFVKAWRAWPPAASTNLAGWLGRIATNTALDALRRARLVSWQPLEAARWLPVDPSTDPQARYAGMLEPLETALARLPERARRLLLLHADFTTAELAHALGVKRRTLASRLSRLRARAARLYAQEEADA